MEGQLIVYTRPDGDAQSVLFLVLASKPDLEMICGTFHNLIEAKFQQCIQIQFLKSYYLIDLCKTEVTPRNNCVLNVLQLFLLKQALLMLIHSKCEILRERYHMIHMCTTMELTNFIIIFYALLDLREWPSHRAGNASSET